MIHQEHVIFGIDLGTTYSCIAYVDEYGIARVAENRDSQKTTPSVVLFEGEHRIVGMEAKNRAIIEPEQVVEMVKRHMGEPHWRFNYEGCEYSAEEISSYILRKVAEDTEAMHGLPVQDVVITCPAYFGINEREATVRAGVIAGLNVREVINEPTAAAISYGLQSEQDQVVLVYDLGGGTFDTTVIEIKAGAITVIATGGDYHLGGRDWDAAVVRYLVEEWRNETGSIQDPTDAPETMQELWQKAEQAKVSLTARAETRIAVAHEGEKALITLTREMFDQLTAPLLENTIMFTATTIQDARARGVTQIDQILLVGGSTKMPQVAERLQREFHLPHKLFEPDEAVAKGAAVYGQKLLIDAEIQHSLGQMLDSTVSYEDIDMTEVSATMVQRAQEEVANDMGLRVGAVQRFHRTSVVNVASHSFGIIAITESNTSREREVISNLVLANDALPAAVTKRFGTREDGQETVLLQVMETTEKTALVEADRYDKEAEIGNVSLALPYYLPANATIEVTFTLTREGRLHVVGREPTSGAEIEATIETRGGISEQELAMAKERATGVTIS